MTPRQMVDRYGAPGAIVLALALLVLLLPGNHDGNDTSVDADQSAARSSNNNGTGGFSDTGGLVGIGGDVSTTPGAGGAGGAAGGGGGSTATPSGGADFEFGKGKNCRADGRQVAIERVAPPCVQWLSKDNGGATGTGVTKDKILVIRYVEQADAATGAILESAQLADDPAVVKRAYESMFKYFNQHYETYGRQVVIQDFNASGPVDNDEQAKADAVKIATEIKPFAVFGGPKVFAAEIVSRGIICICTTTLSRDFYTSLPPYMFGTAPTSTEYAKHVGEYVGKKLWNRQARFVGQGFTGNQTAKRKFGLIYLEGVKGKVDPEGKRFRDALVAEMGKYGAKFAEDAVIGYTYDPGRNQQDITTMMTLLRANGVTSVLMFVDPLSPILITGEATRQGYFPEWVITGTGLSDTTTAARLYDQTQWRHAFGISPLYVSWATVSKSGGYRAAHHGNPNLQPGEEGVLINIYALIPRVLFTGIQMAGPKLNATSFSNGLFAYPRSGGTPASPTQYYTREAPMARKDFMEIYYDASKSGIDERGVQGGGMIVKMAGGKRYQQGEWSTEETKAFNDPTAIANSDDPAMGGDPDHESDGHKHTTACLSC